VSDMISLINLAPVILE